MICVCGKPALPKHKTCGDPRCLNKARAHPPALNSRAKFRLHESDVWCEDRWVAPKHRDAWKARC